MSIISKIRVSLNNCKVALVLSIVFMIGSLILVFTKGLNYGIDFAGGVLIEARIESNPDISKIREALSNKIDDIHIQESGENDVLIRVSKASQNQDKLIKKIHCALTWELF